MKLQIAARCVVPLLLALALAGPGCSKKSKKHKNQGAPGQVDLPISTKLIERLPVAPGHPLPKIYAALEVRRDGVFFLSKRLTTIQNGRIPSTSKRDGPDGFFVDPLYKQLNNEQRKLKHSKLRGPHCLLLAADRDLSYRTLAEVLYTTAQARFDCIYVAVNPPPANKLGLAVIRLHSPKVTAASRSRSGALSKAAGGLKALSTGAMSSTTTGLKRGASSYKDTLAELTNMEKKPNPKPTLRGHVSAQLPPLGKPAKQFARARNELRTRLYGLRLCYSGALRRNPKAAGTARISLVIPQKGRVQSVRVKTNLAAATQKCFATAVGIWHLGPVPKKTSYTFTVTFSPKK